MKNTLVEEVEETWLTKAEALQKWGKDGLKDRLQKGTIQARRKSASVLSSLLFCPHVSTFLFVQINCQPMVNRWFGFVVCDSRGIVGSSILGSNFGHIKNSVVTTSLVFRNETQPQPFS